MKGLGKTVFFEMRNEANNLIANKDTKDSGLLLMSWAISSEKGSHLAYMVDYAKPDLIAQPKEFDRNPDLVNVLDGTYDFTIGEIREHRASDMITKVTDAAYGDGSDDHRVFAQFIDDIADGDVGLAVYIQQVLGLALSGDRSIEHMWFPNGDGDNGKTVLFEITGEVMGDYAGIGQNSDIIDHGKYSTAKPFGLANLVGKRRAVYAEIGKEDKLNWSVLKAISGADTTTTEEKFKQAVASQLECKIFIYCNDLPTVDQVGEAEWSRIRVIPFSRCWNDERPECCKQDRHLMDKLRRHKSAILRWLIQGEMLRRDFGLLEPAVVTEATKVYREDNDILAEWLKECTVKAPGVRTRGRKLYRAFENWYSEPGEWTPTPLKEPEFGKALKAHGYPSRTIKGCATHLGIALKPEYDPEYEQEARRSWSAMVSKAPIPDNDDPYEDDED